MDGCSRLLQCRSFSTSGILVSYQTVSGALPPPCGLEENRPWFACSRSIKCNITTTLQTLKVMSFMILIVLIKSLKSKNTEFILNIKQIKTANPHIWEPENWSYFSSELLQLFQHSNSHGLIYISVNIAVSGVVSVVLWWLNTVDFACSVMMEIKKFVFFKLKSLFPKFYKKDVK